MNRFSYGLIAIIVLLMCSCKKNGINVPNGIRPYKMDIVGATAIGCNNGNTTKAADGEMQLYDRGLFKIDGQGNISTVTTYFTEDKKGNKDFKDYKITVTVNEIERIGSDLLLFKGCWYYFENGEPAYDLGKYMYLLVKISDGLIFHVPNEIYDSCIGKFAKFTEDKEGAVYSNNGRVVGKITVFGSTATFQQINTTGSGIVLGDFVVLENGVVCSMDGFYFDDVTFLWPNGGFCSAKDIINGNPNNRYYYVFVKDGILCMHEYYSYNEGTNYSFHYVNAGNNPGDISLTDAFSNIFIGKGEDNITIYKSVFLETETHYLFNSGSCIYAVNKQTGEHKIIPIENYRPAFLPLYEFDGKYWRMTDIDDENGPGFYWFDPTSFQSGFVKVDNLPSYAESKFYEYEDTIDNSDGYSKDGYSNGYINFEVVRPSDGYNIIIKIDITTGRVEVLENAPERIFTTFIKLS